MSAHTPGPWEIVAEADSTDPKRLNYSLHTKDGGWLFEMATCASLDDDERIENDANLALIAAAPDMAKALRLIAETSSDVFAIFAACEALGIDSAPYLQAEAA